MGNVPSFVFELLVLGPGDRLRVVIGFFVKEIFSCSAMLGLCLCVYSVYGPVQSRRFAVLPTKD